MTPPNRIGRYEVRERIGQGGMGVLYLAFDPAIDRLVAVKLLRVHDDELQQRFYREARSIGRLQHPNIVTIYDIGEHEGHPFIAMEYIAGETLADVIRRKAPFALTRKLELVEALCGGLAAAHKVGIVHRDVKPANLMLNTQGVLKILDFGIARLVDSSETMTGSMIGTPSYMSPEQVEGRALDHRSDIFSVGLVFYELIAYRQAFTGDSSIAIMQSVMSAPLVPLSDIMPDLDAGIEPILLRATEKRVDARYPDLDAMRVDVTRVRSRLVETQSDDTIYTRPDLPQPTPIPTPRRATDRAAIARRRAEEIQAHVADGFAALDAGNLDSAQHLAEQAAFLDPDDPRAIELLDQVRVAQDHRQVETWLGEARRHLEDGQLTASQRFVERALELAPEAEAALALKSDVDRIRQERERQAALAREVESALREAGAQLEAGALDAAHDLCLKAIALAPAHAGALEALRDVEAAIVERERRAAEALRQRQAEEARREAEEQARREAEERSRRHAEEKARREAEENARREADERARRVAEENARRRVEEKARRDADANARREADERARRLAQENARRHAEEEVRREGERRRLAEETARRAAAERRAEEEERRVAEVRTPAQPAPHAVSPAVTEPLPRKRRRAALAAAAALAGVALTGAALYFYAGRPVDSGGSTGRDLGPRNPSGVPTPPSVEEDVDAVIRSAHAAYEQGRVKEALDALRSYPTRHARIDGALRDLTDRYNAAVAAAIESAKRDFASGRRSQAIASLERLQPTSPAIEEALADMRGSLSNDEERFGAQIASARGLLGRDDLTSALREAQAAQRARPGDPRAVSLLNDVLDAAATKARTAREAAERTEGATARDAFATAITRERQAGLARGARNFSGALEEYQGATQLFGRAVEEASAARGVADALAKWAAESMATARQLAASRRFDEATRVLIDVKERAPNTPGLEALTRDVQAQRIASASNTGGRGPGAAPGGDSGNTPPPPPPPGGGDGGRGTGQPDLPGINRALQEFQAAYNSRNLQALKSAYAVDRRAEDVYKALFDRSASLDWAYQIENTLITGADATVTCGVVVTSVDIRNQRTTSNRRYRVTMHKDGDKWRIVRMEVM
jgi:tetratricopeptide (TPR) repeat protein